MASLTGEEGQLPTGTASNSPSSGGLGLNVQIRSLEPENHTWQPAYSQQNPLLEAEDGVGNPRPIPCCAACEPVITASGGRVRELPKEQLEDYFQSRPYVPVDFDAVFQEPEEAGGLEISYIINKVLYYWTKRCVYVLLSSLLGPILAVPCGIIFALLQFINFWIVNPIFRIIHIIIKCFGFIYRPLIRLICDPLFEAAGQSLKQLKADKFTERSYKLNVTGVTFGQSVAHHQETGMWEGDGARREEGRVIPTTG